MKDVLMAGFGASRMLELQAPKMIARDFDGKVESRLHYKDILIVLDLARELGIELPASRIAADLLAGLQERGGATQDSAAIFTVLGEPHPRRNRPRRSVPTRFHTCKMGPCRSYRVVAPRLLLADRSLRSPGPLLFWRRSC